MSRAEIRVKQKNLDEAAKCVHRMATIDAKAPETLQAQYRMASKYSELNRPDDAIDWLNQILKVNQSAADAYTARGIAYYQKHDLRHAQQDFEQVLRISPKYPQGQERLDAILRHSWPIQRSEPDLLAIIRSSGGSRLKSRGGEVRSASAEFQLPAFKGPKASSTARPRPSRSSWQCPSGAAFSVPLKVDVGSGRTWAACKVWCARWILAPAAGPDAETSQTPKKPERADSPGFCR